MRQHTNNTEQYIVIVMIVAGIALILGSVVLASGRLALGSSSLVFLYRVAVFAPFLCFAMVCSVAVSGRTRPLLASVFCLIASIVLNLVAVAEMFSYGR